MTETKKLENRIADLEEEVASAVETGKKLEKQLADAYADGSDPAKVLAKLTENRAAVAGMVSALKAMDIKVYHLAEAEHKTASEKLDRETHERFNRAVAAADAALVPLKKALQPVIGQNGLAPLLERITLTTQETIWQVLDGQASEVYADRVPGYPQVPQARDAEGKSLKDIQVKPEDLAL